jgi:hypothetical protein
MAILFPISLSQELLRGMLQMSHFMECKLLQIKEIRESGDRSTTIFWQQKCFYVLQQFVVSIA